MFRYFLTFLLVNTCYQSLGIPLQPIRQRQVISNSLNILASQCENHLLADILKSKLEYCTINVPPYSKRQFQCLILYDMSTQLCTAVASAKLAITKESLLKIDEKQDVNAVCTQAKEWVFTNITEYVNYTESAEKFFKLPATCGEVCGVEEAMTEANYYCKFFKWGLEMLKSQVVSTMANNANNNAAAAPAITEPDFNAKADIPVPINSNPIITQETKTKTYSGQIKQTETVAAKTTPQKNTVDEEVAKSETAAQATSKQTLNEDDNADKVEEESDVNVNPADEPVPAAPENVIPSGDAANKSKVVNEEKPAIGEDTLLPEAGKDLSAPVDQKLVPVLDNPKPKPGVDAEDYGDSDGNDNVGDDDGEDPGLEIKPQQEEVNQNNFVRNKSVLPSSHESDASQKEYFPNSMPDGFSDEDNDHFFPFFMTSVVLMVLLYVLYHNKSKVSKVFFGLILEGRQSGRRRNSRGHAYRRLDTLEQAMSANTAAPPSKIIY
ncbi:hypothetical protein B5X24_HaOG206528 [Helicoverpa armigera]|uniref:Uncharacterized protein n=1 Tax=Helicoverpa armigera TaxID=29058 RepID=A0A2W1BRG1_HELAM|nr:hypothetical protein B5X24_HaOG206528 [Helicoverpa armigera]